jgi:hypothetical protein
MSLLHHDARSEALAQLSCFRGEFYSCLTARSDALFELADAVLCGDGPVRSLAELSLVGEHRRGHGGLYAALARGRIDAGRLRRALAEVPLPRAADGRLVLAIDITCWLRPDAHTSPQRILCHTYGRGKDQHIPVPGWPYSIVCALEPGRSSWTAPLDALRLTPGDDTAIVTARQLRDLLQRLITAGQWQTGDPDILIVADAGYDAPRLGFLLKDLPVQVLARMRSDRVLRRAVPPRLPHAQGRPPRHGGEFVFGQPDTWGTPDTETVTDTRLYGTATARSWNRLHPKLTHRSSWAAADGTLPIATSYPETGRWGTGAAMEAAEAVFGADARSLAAQFTQPTRPHSQALAAANFVAITTAFTGNPHDGMDWLVKYGRIDAPQPLNRAVLDTAVRLADPTDDWAALRAAPGGAAICDTWKPRRALLAGLTAVCCSSRSARLRRTLAGSVLWQTELPVGLGLLVVGLPRTALGGTLLGLVGRPMVHDWSTLQAIAGIGAAASVGVTLLTLPTLWPSTRAQGLRHE